MVQQGKGALIDKSDMFKEIRQRNMARRVAAVMEAVTVVLEDQWTDTDENKPD